MYKIIIVLSLIFSNIVYAQEGKSTFLKQGVITPYSGLLLDNVAMAQLIAKSEFEKKKCALDLEYALLKQKNLLDLEINKLKVDIDTANKKYDAIIKIKDDELKRVNEIAIKESNKNSYKEWWFVGGVVAGLVMAIGVSYGMNK